MEAKRKIRVEFLSQKDAWELFKMKVGEETLNLHPDIPKLAMAAAEECGGLPIALVAIGRAMASKKTLREWKQALKALKKAPSKISEFEENSSIFSRLQGLRLSDLPELKSIYRHALPFPSLAVINVTSCPKLKKLPLDSNSAKNCFKKILAEKQWWDELEWDADSTRLHFLPYLVPHMF